MSIYSLSQVYDWDIDSEFDSIAVGKKYVWGTLKNKSLIVIDKSNYKKFTIIPLQHKSQTLPRLILDSSGDNCAILYQNGDVFHASSQFTTFSELKYPRSSIATCGTWVEQTNKTSLILCTQRGEVLQIFLKSMNRCQFIYALPKPEEIYSISIQTEPQIFIFLKMKDRIIYFHGTDSLEFVFASGAANHNFMLPPNTPTISNSLLTTSEGTEFCRLVTPFANGIMIFEAVGSENKTVTFSQNFIGSNSSERITGLEILQWGVLVCYKSTITFYSFEGGQCQINFPDTFYLKYEDKEILISNGIQMCVITLNNFREHIASEAIENGNYVLAEYIGQGVIDVDTLLFRKILTMDPDEGAKVIMSKNWNLEKILLKLKEKPLLAISVLKLYVEKIPRHLSKQRTLVFHLILSYYCFLYPNSKDDMVEFIVKNKRYMMFNRTLKQLQEFEIYEGIVALCDPKSEKEALLELYISRRDIPKIFEIINREYDENFVLKILLRILPFADQEIAKFLSANTVIRSSSLIPLLATNPEFATKSIKSDFPNIDTDNLMYLSYARLGQDGKIVRKMTRGYPDAAFLLRTCKKYGMTESVSRLWLDMGNIERAIDVSFSKGKKFAINIANGLFNQEEKQRAWIRILQLANEQDKAEMVNKILEENIFSFEDLIEYVNGSELTAAYTDMILKASEDIQKESEPVSFEKFDESSKHRNISITFNTECCLCGQKLVGTQFVCYQCGHFCHSDCVQEFIDHFTETGVILDSNHIHVTDSCPVCGFLSISSIMEPY